MRLTKTRLLSLFVSGALIAPAFAGDHEEGGYAGTSDQGHTTVVYNFLKHFSYNQYYYSAYSQWTWYNDYRVDAMDISIFGGHGNRWAIWGQDGTKVDLRYAGNQGDLGYGDTDCEFVVFESCYVVPSPIEVSDWYSNWTRSGGLFDGLHQALGFRTLSWQSTDEDITDDFGWYVRREYGVWESWFASINNEGRSDEKGSAVMYPACDGGTYSYHVADPPRDHTSLRCWYQY